MRLLAGLARRKRPTISVSAAAYEQLRGEAKRRGLSVTKVAEERIAKLTGKEIA